MTRPLRLIFMGTPEFAVPTLEALVASAKNKLQREVSRPSEPSADEATSYASGSMPRSGDIKIVAVYTQPPRPAGRGQQLKKSPVHALAEQQHIPVFTPTSLKTPEAQAEFAALQADVAVVVAYGLLLPQAILDAPTHGCINIHPSALPRWRGAAPIQRTIMAGDTTTEICIMQMDAGLDTGAIYKRSAPIPIPQHMNAGELHDILATQSAPLLLEVLAEFATGTANARPQATNGITYAQKITKDECRIDWSKSATEIVNQVRGLAPSPGAYFEYQGERFKILDADASRLNVEKYHGDVTPGRVIDNHLTIACGHGLLHPQAIQRAGKSPMAVQEMLKGFDIPAGTLLLSATT